MGIIMSNLGRFPGSSLLQILTSRAMWEEIPGGSDNRRPSMAIFSIDFIFKIQNYTIKQISYYCWWYVLFLFLHIDNAWNIYLTQERNIFFFSNINGFNMFPTPLITQYLLSFQSPWETTLRAAPLWFQVPTAVQQSSTCLLPSGWCPLVVSEGLKSCNTIQLYMYHKSSKIINIQHLLLQSIIILVQHGHFCFKTCLIYEFIISIFIANTLLFLKCTILEP